MQQLARQWNQWKEKECAHLRFCPFAHIFAFQTCANERRPQPSDQSIGGCETKSAESERCDDRRTIALEGLSEDGKAYG